MPRPRSLRGLLIQLGPVTPAEPIEGQDAICQAQIGILHSNPNSLTRGLSICLLRVLFAHSSVEDGGYCCLHHRGAFTLKISIMPGAPRRGASPGVPVARRPILVRCSLRFLVTYSSSRPLLGSAAPMNSPVSGSTHYTLSASRSRDRTRLPYRLSRQWDNPSFSGLLGRARGNGIRISSVSLPLTCEEPGSIFNRLLESHLKINDVW